MILISISFIVLTKTVDILRIHIVYRTKEAGYCSYRCNGSIVIPHGYIHQFIYHMCRLLRGTLSFTKISICMVTVIITPDATVPLYLRYHTPILSKHPNVHKQTKLVISSQPSSSPCKYPLHYKGLCIFTATQSNQTILVTKSLYCIQ